MGDFTEKQTEIIESFFRTGDINNQQIAVILPALVRWVFAGPSELKLKRELERLYGGLPEDAVFGLGTELLQKNQEARVLVVTMLSRLRKAH